MVSELPLPESSIPKPAPLPRVVSWSSGEEFPRMASSSPSYHPSVGVTSPLDLEEDDVDADDADEEKTEPTGSRSAASVPVIAQEPEEMAMSTLLGSTAARDSALPVPAVGQHVMGPLCEATIAAPATPIRDEMNLERKQNVLLASPNRGGIPSSNSGTKEPSSTSPSFPVDRIWEAFEHAWDSWFGLPDAVRAKFWSTSGLDRIRFPLDNPDVILHWKHEWKRQVIDGSIRVPPSQARPVRFV